MTTSTDADGRRRVWYSHAQIELLCEGLLRESGLLPADGACEVDIERLVEHELAAIVDYSAKLAPSVLGFTIFESPPRVVVNGSLTEGATRPDAPAGLLGRWRATLAHEAAHIILHARLYDAHPDVPGRRPAHPVRCLRSTVEQDGGKPDWREVQANMGMAALLMPKSLLEREATAFLRANLERALPPVGPDDPVVIPMVQAIASKFTVSKQSAEIRLETCGYIRHKR